MTPLERNAMVGLIGALNAAQLTLMNIDITDKKRADDLLALVARIDDRAGQLFAMTQTALKAKPEEKA